MDAVEEKAEDDGHVAAALEGAVLFVQRADEGVGEVGGGEGIEGEGGICSVDADD